MEPSIEFVKVALIVAAVVGLVLGLLKGRG